MTDTDELYDLREDPLETNNLIFNPERKATIQDMNKRLFDIMEARGAMQIPLRRDVGPLNNKLLGYDTKASPFPEKLKIKPK